MSSTVFHLAPDRGKNVSLRPDRLDLEGPGAVHAEIHPADRPAARIVVDEPYQGSGNAPRHMAPRRAFRVDDRQAAAPRPVAAPGARAAVRGAQASPSYSPSRTSP